MPARERVRIRFVALALGLSLRDSQRRARHDAQARFPPARTGAEPASVALAAVGRGQVPMVYWAAAWIWPKQNSTLSIQLESKGENDAPFIFVRSEG